MNIERLNKTEAARVADIFNQYRVFYGQASDIEGATAYIHRRLSGEESIIYVMFEDNDDKKASIGFVQLYPLYSSVNMVKNWILNDLFILPSYRGQGAGSSLIKTAVAMAESVSAKFIQLETATDNHSAQRLYEKLGFTRQPIESDYLVYKLKLS